MLLETRWPARGGGGPVRPARGFTLIEVLVALIVLSIGLLGLAALQLQSLKHNSDAYFRTQATILAYDIIDRMRANVDAVAAGYYVASAPPSTAQECGSTSGGCASPAELAASDLTDWYRTLENTLPLPATPSSIALSAGNTVTVTVRWNERGVPKARTWVVVL